MHLPRLRSDTLALCLLAVSCLVNVLGVARPWAGPDQTPVQLVVHLLLDGLP